MVKCVIIISQGGRMTVGIGGILSRLVFESKA